MTLGEISMVIGMIGALPYIYQIIRGQVRPERTTWFVWSVILTIAAWSYRSSGATDSLWFLVGDLIVTLIIFGLSLWRGSGGWTKLDVSCLGVAIFGLAVWMVADVSAVALAGVLLADAVALLPTLIKALRDPYSESASTYAFSSVAALCGFAAVGEWNGLLLLYPAYLFLANFTTAMVIVTGKYYVSRLVAANKE
jgi:hypothetical protein